MNIESASLMLDALGNPVRLRIFHVIAKAGDDGLYVNELVERIGMPPATLSHHLDKLTKSGLVLKKKIKNNVLCRTDAAAIMALSAYLLRPIDETEGGA